MSILDIALAIMMVAPSIAFAVVVIIESLKDK